MLKKIHSNLIVMAIFLSLTIQVQAEIHSEEIAYEIAGKPFLGYLSYDDSIIGKRPAVIVVHEWWGHNAYARKRADRLARLGYTAFALDMYGAGKLAQHPDDAKKFMQAVISDMKIAETRFNHAKEILQKHTTVDKNKMAAIGYCFGGGTVLHMARQGTDLLGVVSFHGSLTTNSPAQKKLLTAKILVLNGADDPFISTEQIAKFKQEMKNSEADYEFVNYPNVKHSFTNPEADNFGKQFNMPLEYNAKADEDSWLRMQKFFKKIFTTD